jgi:hypothetical protein
VTFMFPPTTLFTGINTNPSVAIKHFVRQF